MFLCASIDFSRKGTKTYLVALSFLIYFIIQNSHKFWFKFSSILLISSILINYWRCWSCSFKDRKDSSDLDAFVNRKLPPLHVDVVFPVTQKEAEIHRREEILRETATTGFDVDLEPRRPSPVRQDRTEVLDTYQETKNLLRRQNSSWRKHMKTRDIQNPLSMDHVKLSFLQYCYGSIFLLPCILAVSVSGWSRYIVSCWLDAYGLYYKIFPKCNYSELAINMLLETSLVLYFSHFEPVTDRNDDDIQDVIAVFMIHDFYILRNHEAVPVKRYELKVNLTKRLLISAVLEDTAVTCAQDTCILLAFILVHFQHPKIHAYANWGINTESSRIGKSGTIIEHVSIITVLYNYFGYSCYPEIVADLQKIGFFPKSNFGPDIKKSLYSGIDSGLHHHAYIVQLMPYSNYVDFLFKIRGHFLNEFYIHKPSEFPYVHGEAFFVGTIIHSLDHSLYLKYFSDPLWSVCVNPEYEWMAITNRPPLIAYSHDLPCLWIQTRFKDIQHPFFQSVYQHARTIDEWMADHMDGCICK